MAYLGTYVYLVDSNNVEVKSYHVLDRHDLAAACARCAAELDRIDPI
jgi:hypothetical protein